MPRRPLRATCALAVGAMGAIAVLLLAAGRAPETGLEDPSSSARLRLRRSLLVNLASLSDPKSAVVKSDAPVDALFKDAKFIFGHSTGHSGSTTVHDALKQPGCPWDGSLVQKFENIPREEKAWEYDPDCRMTREVLLPFLQKSVESKGIRDGGATYIDLGHYHNRGRVLECLATILGPRAAFVRVRRNRYSIAQSFVKHKNVHWTSVGFETPCMDDNNKDGVIGKKGLHRPMVAVCPRSGERAGPANLPVNDEIWDSFTPFQRFLWYADEVEHRWHTLQQMFHDRPQSERPEFHEVTWHDEDDMEAGIQSLRSAFGCTNAKIRNRKGHVEHAKKHLDCGDMVRQDLEYRNAMGYDAQTSNMLFDFSPFGDLDECSEGGDELRQVVGQAYRPKELVAPPAQFVAPPAYGLD